MRAADADALGARAVTLAAAGDVLGAVALFSTETAKRNVFAMLDRAGRLLGDIPLERLDPVVHGLARTGAEGAWPIIGSALGQHIGNDLPGVLARCRGLITNAGVWYVTDILGERVPGPALVGSLLAAADALSPWRFDQDRWVRRAVGVAVHYWAKRDAGRPGGLAECLFLLDYLRPMVGERSFDAAKGVGWALKTIGRYRPAVLEAWLRAAMLGDRGGVGPVVLRKALTYLPESARERVRAG